MPVLSHNFCESTESTMYSANRCSRLCLCSRCSTQPAILRCFLSQPVASPSVATRCPSLRASESHTLTAGPSALAMEDAPGIAAFTEDVQAGELAISITRSNPNGPERLRCIFAITSSMYTVPTHSSREDVCVFALNLTLVRSCAFARCEMRSMLTKDA